MTRNGSFTVFTIGRFWYSLMSSSISIQDVFKVGAQANTFRRSAKARRRPAQIRPHGDQPEVPSPKTAIERTLDDCPKRAAFLDMIAWKRKELEIIRSVGA